MTRTFYSYFRGGNGVGVGVEKAGYTDVGGVEFDAQIAAVCDMNFEAKTTIADVCAVDPALLLDAAPTWFHASPSCKNASAAKTPSLDEDGNTVRETEADRAAGSAVARFITHWKPQMVTIENVWQYRTFDAFEAIREALRDAGYSYEYWHLNSADYGVPQTRKRLILVARRGLRFIQRPSPTHRQGGDMFLPNWNGWYGAISDLIPSLPASQFAAWQEAKIPEHLRTMLIAQGTYDDQLVTAEQCAPAFTVTSNGNQSGVRAFIVHDQRSMPVRDGEEPMFTVVAAAPDTRPRAFLVNGDNMSRDLTLRARAFLVGEDSKMGIVSAEQPAMTTVSSHRAGNTRARLSQGRVVKMSARALCRFQSLPDTYKLPEKKTRREFIVASHWTPQQQHWIEEQERCANGLACTVIGNMVCPDLAESVARSQGDM